MKEFNFREIEPMIRRRWEEEAVYQVTEQTDRPACYILDMFPYPSGAGLHVGHPLGYIASDIVARFKRLNGFNVLHPMGYDSFGLPAEQYAIQTGQHPRITTEENIARYREQMDRIGFSFDWSREVRTSDPRFYRWTQWIFLQIFNSWYNRKTDRAEPVAGLIEQFEAGGNSGIDAVTGETKRFTATEWNQYSEREKQEVLMNYRLTYLDEAYVNWCPQLGTVLANDEVKDGVSERGGYPVERKRMKQWMMRITAYADRLLESLDQVDWSESMKELQRNWIGKSEGCLIRFQLQPKRKEGNDPAPVIEVFTTRPDTIFGVTYLTLAPEHELIGEITTDEYRERVMNYVQYAKNRAERERMMEKKISGQFTGAYAIHPFTGDPVPVWIGEYVLGGYGTGAVMAVPGHDSRDFAFAKHFDLPIREVVQGGDLRVGAYEGDGIAVNSGFLDGLPTQEAKRKIKEELERLHLGVRRINYKLRDAVFGRQRYWGEPIPVYYKDGIPNPMEASELPLVLPEIDKYLPTEAGDPPLARAEGWKYRDKYELEKTTMPGWAGSSWYFLRYMDPGNPAEFASRSKMEYWNQIDLYVGGAEHGTGHLLYFRFWTKILKDLGYIKIDEPAKKLVNQGMIQGVSQLVYRHKIREEFISHDLLLVNTGEYYPLHADIELVNDRGILDIDGFKKWRPEYRDFTFLKNNDGNFICAAAVEKMSKSKYNVVNPDQVMDKYGADCFRLYEMFMGPIEMSKPWDTKGIDGVSRFLRKFWRLFYDEEGKARWADQVPTADELRILHRTIKKVTEDTARLSFNTTVSALMITVNELTELQCANRYILKDLLILLSPMAPFVTDYLWREIGEAGSIVKAGYPVFNAQYVTENEFEYPVSVNGKTRTRILFPLDLEPAEVELAILQNEVVQKWMEGKAAKKIIFVKGRMINVVV